MHREIRGDSAIAADQIKVLLLPKETYYLLTGALEMLYMSLRNTNQLKQLKVCSQKEYLVLINSKDTLGDSGKFKKRLCQYDSSNNFIQSYQYIKDAAAVLNLHYSGISRCAAGKQNTAGGFIWRWELIGEQAESK